jgi:hypothetical protein
MDEQEFKQLQREVIQLKQTVAAQAQHISLLLALARTGISPHRADIEKAIEALPLGNFPEINQVKQQSKKLIALYFP